MPIRGYITIFLKPQSKEDTVFFTLWLKQTLVLLRHKVWKALNKVSKLKILFYENIGILN